MTIWDKVTVCFLFPFPCTLLSFVFFFLKTALIHAHNNNRQNNHIF